MGWIAALWQLFLIGTLTLPKINQEIGLTTLGMFAVALVWYLIHVRPKTGSGEAGPPGSDTPQAFGHPIPETVEI